MKRRIAILLLAFLSLAAQSPDTAPHNDSIRQEDLKADLYFLASDAMQGRLTGTPENRLTAEFIRSRFERLGLKPAGPNGSFLQPYNLMTATLGEENLLEVIESDNARLRLRPAQDYYLHRFSSSGRVRGSLVFAGFGIVSPKLDYDDYRGDAVKGKIVLVLEHEPGERDPNSPFDGLVTSEPSSPLRKALAAQQKGAIGILFVADVHNHREARNFEALARTNWPEKPPRIERYTLASWAEKVRIPAAEISPSLAETLIRRTGRSLEELSQSAETARGFTPLPLAGPEIILTATVNRHIQPDRNVVGLIEGSDARLKDEWVIVCAHYDHNGADASQVFNGADDDGSGTVAVLEIAEAYALAARAGQRPRRSLLFAAWNSEERGLLGAWAYAENPLHPLEKTVAVLNMDMIGRNEEIPEGGGQRFNGLEIQTAESNKNAVNIMGYSRSADLKAEVEKANRAIGVELRFRYDNNRSNLLRRSDNWPFLQRGVPALFFHTGLHPDYHTQYDRPEKINYAKMERIARLVHQMSWNLAQQDARPKLNSFSK